MLDENVVRKMELQIRDGMYHYVHFGTPCTSFSRAVRPKFQLRSRRDPVGPESNEKIRIGNQLVRNTLRLIQAAEETGVYWSLENPAGSYMWLFPGVAELKAKHFGVSWDMCSHGGKLDGMYYKKPTGLGTNCSALTHLSRRCNKKHEHIK